MLQYPEIYRPIVEEAEKEYEGYIKDIYLRLYPGMMAQDNKFYRKGNLYGLYKEPFIEGYVRARIKKEGD